MGQLAPVRVAGGLGFGAAASVAGSLAAPLLLAAALCLGLSACGGGNGEKLGERVIPLGQPVPKGGGTYQIGKPYEVAGLWFTPQEDPSYDRVGTASWYGELFHGRRTANGEIYDMDALSAAHPTLPLPIYARVTNLNNGRTIVVRINDRGPYARDRIIDLSRRSAELLGFRNNGTATVRVKYLGRAPLSGDDRYERQFLASQRWMQYASKGKRVPEAVGSIPGQDTLPPENPENLAHPWKQAAPYNQVTPADPGLFPWGPAAKPAVLRQPDTTGAIPPSAKPSGEEDGFVIQAGSFKSQENAERARTTLGALAPVEVTPVDVGGSVYFRVRVGPFSPAAETETALARVKEAGFAGAKIVVPN